MTANRRSVFLVHEQAVRAYGEMTLGRTTSPGLGRDGACGVEFSRQKSGIISPGS